MQCALVNQIILVHLHHANQNAWLVPTVLKIVHASIPNVKIPVLARAELTHVVKQLIITRFVVVLITTLEILLFAVYPNRVSFCFFQFLVNYKIFLLEPEIPAPTGNPCVPSPCGLNSQCRVVGTQPACSCLPSYIGRPPNCRPECTINAECPGNLACQNEKCKDPCPGSCGSSTTCTVLKHSPVCVCISGYTGDPFTGCSLIPPRKIAFCFIHKTNL